MYVCVRVRVHVSECLCAFADAGARVDVGR